jgi:hypothetical protein
MDQDPSDEGKVFGHHLLSASDHKSNLKKTTEKCNTTRQEILDGEFRTTKVKGEEIIEELYYQHGSIIQTMAEIKTQCLLSSKPKELQGKDQL